MLLSRLRCGSGAGGAVDPLRGQPLLLLVRKGRRVVSHLAGFAGRRRLRHFGSHHGVHKVDVMKLKIDMRALMLAYVRWDVLATMARFFFHSTVGQVF